MDGEAGRIRNLLFDDRSWTIRYFVISVGNFIKRRDVALALAVVEQPHWINCSFLVGCSRDHVLKSPEVISGSRVTLQRPDAIQERSSVLDRWFNGGFDEETIMLHGQDDAVRAMKIPHLRSSRELSDYGF
jgi:hypothetical protein